jgi:hypothetical protein
MEQLPHWLIGAATVLLFVATIFLWKATRQLAKSAAEDGRLRKIQTTTDTWMKLRPTLVLPNLTRMSDPREIESAAKDALPQIVSLEIFAACVNSGAYDREIFNRISGAWFLQHFKWIEPFIKLPRSGENRPYDELVKLNADLTSLRAGLNGTGLNRRLRLKPGQTEQPLKQVTPKNLVT